DGWRRPEQVETQLALVEVLSPTQGASLRHAWLEAAAVSPKALVDAGYQGAEIGKALDQERLVAIKRVLSEGA
ncbi:MAG: polynucleotide adenylyltransferase, partial [Pseudomonadota bacterium]